MDERPKASWRGVAFASAYGAIAATIAYLLSGGNPIVMLAIMVVIGILVRVYAYRLIRRRGAKRPPWWKWL
jgi:hypothetical protein